MRIALFSDCHGNRFALDAVLTAIEQEGPFEQTIAAGDVCMGGSEPQGCLNLIRDADIGCVYGNTDEFLTQPDVVPGDALHSEKWTEILQDVEWASERIGQDGIDWLAALPFSIVIKPESNPGTHLRIVQANPLDVELMIYPDPDLQQQIWGRVVQPDQDPALQRALSACEEQHLAFGHLHFSSTRTVGQQKLYNISPVSLPVFGPDLQARFSILEWDGISWSQHIHVVKYDYWDELAALEASTMPGRAYYRQAYLV
jgi:hypothetical protein